MKLLRFFALILRNSPFYPYYYYFKFCWKDNESLLEFIDGKTLEVGCGESQFKDFVVKNKPDVDYIASDYIPEGKQHYQFKESHNKLKNYLFNLDFLRDIFIGPVSYGKIDLNLDCRDLQGVDSESLDTYISLEVAEHVYDYKSKFSEAHRVLKKNGKIIISVPFLYQEHGLDSEIKNYKIDFNRFTRTKISTELKNLGFDEVKIFTNCGFFIGLTQLINSYILVNYYKLNFFYKILFFPFLPIFFFIINLLFRFMDLCTKNDEKYYPRLNFIFKKSNG